VDLAAVNTVIQSSGYSAAVKDGKLTFTSTTKGVPGNPQSLDTSALTIDGKVSGTAKLTAGTDATLNLSDGKGHELQSQSTIHNGVGSNSYVFNNGLILTTTDKGGELRGSAVITKAGSSSRGQDLQYQIGANQGQTTTISIASIGADQIGQKTGDYVDANGVKQTTATDSVADINVTTFKGAQDAIAVIDKAIGDVSTTRANIGAFQTNVLQSNVNSLNVASQNLSSSKSTITDADLASTVVQYTKDSILVQSATSALSYANQQPQQVLKLLNG